MLDVLQTALDWIGWIPGFGDMCDALNAAISFVRNDLIGALISVTCMVFSVVADALLKPLKNSESLTKVAQVIKDRFGAGVSKIAKWIGAVANKLKNIPLIGKLFQKISSAFTKFKNFVVDTFNKIVRKKVGETKYSHINPCDKIAKKSLSLLVEQHSLKKF